MVAWLRNQIPIPDFGGILMSYNRNADATLNYTNSISGLTEPGPPEVPETSPFFVSDVSLQEKNSDSKDCSSDSQEEENTTSLLLTGSDRPVADGIPSAQQNGSESKITQMDKSSKQIHSKHEITEVAPSLQQNDSPGQATEAAPPKQNDYDSQVIEATSSLQQTNSHSPTTEAAPSLQQNESHSPTIDTTPHQQNDSHSPTTEATPSLQQNNSHFPSPEDITSIQESDFQDQITLVDREEQAEASAAERAGIPNINDETSLSTTNQPDEFNNVRTHETTHDHPVPTSQHNWSAMSLARIHSAIRGLSEKREALLGMRVKAQESRNSARHKRSALAELNAEILQDSQRRAALGLSANSVSSPELWLKLQDSLEELQVTEAELSVTEDLLNRGEWELKEAELAVYQSRDFQHAEILGEESPSFIEEVIAETASDSTFGAQLARTPLEKQYLSRKGDADILAEEIDELRAHRAYLVEEDRARRAMGMSLDAESQRFLENFDARHNQLQQDLFYAEEDIFRLQTMLSNTHDDVLYTASHFDLTEAGDSLLSDDGNAPDPLLLNKETPSPGFSNLPSEFDQSSLSTIDYINEWLLQRLRRSPLEILLFKSELQDVHLDSELLKDLVLRTWPRDDMSKDYLEAQRRSRRSFSYNARSRRPNLSIQAARSDSDIYHVNPLGHRSQRGDRITSRHRSSVTLDLLNNSTLHRPSTASSV